MKIIALLATLLFIVTPAQAGCEWILWHLVYEPKLTAAGKPPERRPVGAYESKGDCMASAARFAGVSSLPPSLREGVKVDSNSLGWTRQLPDGVNVHYDCLPGSFDYKGSSGSYYK